MNVKRIDADKAKSALNDIKNASKLLQNMQLGKDDNAAEFDQSIYDPVTSHACDFRDEWSKQEVLTDDEVNKWIENMFASESLRDPPEPMNLMDDVCCTTPVSEPEDDGYDWIGSPPPLPMDDDSFLLEEDLQRASITPICVNQDMRANLSLPYGDESLNRSVFELNLSDSDEEWMLN